MLALSTEPTIASVFAPKTRIHEDGTVEGYASLFGAIGSVHGPLIGSFILSTINNGANLLNVNTFWQRVITGALIIVIVYFDAPRTVAIDKGENNGRRLTYWNAVTGIQTAGMWHGKAQRYELPMTEITKKGGCAVLLQSVGKDGMPGPILGAAFIHKPDRL